MPQRNGEALKLTTLPVLWRTAGNHLTVDYLPNCLAHIRHLHHPRPSRLLDEVIRESINKMALDFGGGFGDLEYLVSNAIVAG